MAKMHPFFTYYGGKYRAAPRYPVPRYDVLVEPFAGSAGYAVRNCQKQVVLCDVDPIIVGVWDYLIRVSPEEILAIPDIPEGGVVADLGLCQEAAWLVGFWVNSAAASPRKSPSKWMRDKIRPGSFWGTRVRHTIASQVPLIRHWEVHECRYEDCPVDGPATWFVDPPYQVAGRHYRHGSGAIDYEHLRDWCLAREGQVIVCENDGATWLPFRHLGDVHSSRGHSKEAIWTNSNERQLRLFGEGP